jgi:integrase
LRYLTIDEEKRLLAALDPKADLPYRPKCEDRPDTENQHRQDNYDLVVLLLDTGARYSEIANIAWDRIDLDQRLIHLWRPKVRNESIIYMPARVFDILKRWSESVTGKHVFTNGKGEARGYTSKGIFRAFERAGLNDFRIHDLRHTAASRLVQNGMNLYEVSQMLGHVDVQTTQRYAHLESRDIGQRARDIIENLSLWVGGSMNDPRSPTKGRALAIAASVKTAEAGSGGSANVGIRAQLGQNGTEYRRARRRPSPW